MHAPAFADVETDLEADIEVEFLSSDQALYVVALYDICHFEHTTVIDHNHILPPTPPKFSGIVLFQSPLILPSEQQTVIPVTMIYVQHYCK